jgi:hypothetical protein
VALFALASGSRGGLSEFTRDKRSIVVELRLPDWSQPGKLVWPSPPPSLAVLMAQDMTPMPHPSDKWWYPRAERAGAQRPEFEHVDAFYSEAREARDAGGHKQCATGCAGLQQGSHWGLRS